MSQRWVFLCALASLPAWGQSVISVYSGVIHLAEGAVLLDGRPLEQKPGRFAEVKAGSELRTEDGRAELLLTPGVILRLGPDSAVRMVSNLLVDTRVEFLNGSVVLDAQEPSPETSVKLLFQGDEIALRNAGQYRLDSTPPELSVVAGRVERLRNGKPIEVAGGRAFDFSTGMLAENHSAQDALNTWNKDRDDAIARENKEANSTPELSALAEDWKNDPLLGGWIGSGGGAAGVGPGLGYSGSLSGLLPLALSPYSLYGNSLLWAPWSPLSPYPGYALPSLLAVPSYRYPSLLRNTPGYAGYGRTSPPVIHSPIYPSHPPGRSMPIGGGVPARPPVRVGHR